MADGGLISCADSKKKKKSWLEQRAKKITAIRKGVNISPDDEFGSTELELCYDNNRHDHVLPPT